MLPFKYHKCIIGVANSIQPILWRRLRDEMYSTPQVGQTLDFPVFYAFHKRTENHLLDQNCWQNKPPVSGFNVL
jgi:hypothetical protein